MDRRRRIAPLVVALPLLLSAACTIRVEGVPVAAPTSSTPTPPTRSPEGFPAPTQSPTPTDEQLPDASGFPADTSDKGGPAQGSGTGPARVQGVRMNTQNGFDRLVITLSTDAVPAWTLRYTDATGPDGGRVDIAGDAFLRLSLQTGGDPGGGNSHTSLSTSPGPIAAVLTTGYGQGAEQVLIGTRGGKAPFHAFALTNPGRIVIDVRPAG